MEAIWEKARDIGRFVVQTDEYKALKSANERISDDRDAVTRMNRLAELQESMTRMVRAGAEPPEEDQQEYERLVEEVQANSAYQALAAAQSNFDRLMMRINEEIARGVEAGEKSRIILPS